MKLVDYGQTDRPTDRRTLSDKELLSQLKTVYVDYRAGLFEVLKKNMMRVLKDLFDVEIVGSPKVEYYGTSGAEERIILDIRLNVSDHTHYLQVRVYNT